MRFKEGDLVVCVAPKEHWHWEEKPNYPKIGHSYIVESVDRDYEWKHDDLGITDALRLSNLYGHAFYAPAFVKVEI